MDGGWLKSEGESHLSRVALLMVEALPEVSRMPDCAAKSLRRSTSIFRPSLSSAPAALRMAARMAAMTPES